MAETTVTTPYASAVAYVPGDLPAWVDEYNAQRLASYNLYDDLWDNVPEQGIAMLRGADDRPIYLPSAKRLIKTLKRYIGRGWGYIIDPALGTPNDQETLKLALSDLFRREDIESTFASGKADLLRRGDWLWYVSADGAKPEGKRISLTTIDPRTYFPMFDDKDPRRLSGCQIAEEHLLEDGKTIALKVQTWLKPNHPDHPNYEQVAPPEGFPIAYTVEVMEISGWQSKEKRKMLSTPTPLAVLPGINALPIYHIKIGTSSDDPFGRSVLAGMESIVAGINQAASDEDVSIALTGIGMFHTTAGAPVDPETKQPVAWQFGPGQVVEHAKDTDFERLTGIDKVDIFQDHIGMLQENLYGTSGVNDLALGRTSAAAESGISLSIKMQPLFDEADEYDDAINGKWNHLLFDLITMWFPTYETQAFGEAVAYVECDRGERLPFDRAQRWTELREGFEAGFFTIAYVHKVLVEEFGYEIDEAEAAKALAEAQTKATMADPFAARAAAELSQDGA